MEHQVAVPQRAWHWAWAASKAQGDRGPGPRGEGPGTVSRLEQGLNEGGPGCAWTRPEAGLMGPQGL